MNPLDPFWGMGYMEEKRKYLGYQHKIPQIPELSMTYEDWISVLPEQILADMRTTLHFAALAEGTISNVDRDAVLRLRKAVVTNSRQRLVEDGEFNDCGS